MLISVRNDGVQAVTQPDHARVAGALAAAWGNERLGFEALSDSLKIAAARHDDGWEVLDGAPAVAAGTGRPAHFLEVPLEATVGPYGAGVERIYADDVYAGVLSSRHWAGLYSARWGVQDSPLLDHPLAREVADAQDQRAAAEARGLWADRGGLRSAFEAALWHDYEVLQTLDFISLALCLVDVREPTAAAEAHVAVPATLRGVVQPPGARLVPMVPLAGSHVTMRMCVLEPSVVEVDPYPFASDSLVVGVPTRSVPAVSDSSDEVVRETYLATDTVTLPITLVGKDG